VFDKYFSLPATLARHRSAPLARERERFLTLSKKAERDDKLFARRPATSSRSSRFSDFVGSET
jgi:hypothetical protein